MGVFAYTGVDDKGRTVRGTVDADNSRTARQLLRKKGIFVDNTQLLNEGAGAPSGNGAAARKAPASPSGKAASAGRGGAVAAESPGLSVTAPAIHRTIQRLKELASSPAQAVAVTTRQLATLLKAGIPLPEALNALIEQIDHEGLRAAFAHTTERVREGIPFARALEEHPDYFPPLFVNMVAAGEASGNMEAVLVRLADFSEAQLKLKNKIVGAMAYPAFMGLFGVVVISVMMVVVVPKVSSIFEDFRRALPWYTELLIGTSRFIGSWWWAILIAVIGAIVALRRWQRTPEGAYRWDAFVLRVPIFGDLARMVAISRFARTLSTLLASGVPLLKAMDIVKNVLGNRVLEGVVAETAAGIKEGESIAEPLKRSGRFPPIVTHMIAVGERSGELESMLEAVANSFDATIDARVAVLTSLLEPMMIALMGGMSGGITFAILMPMLQLNEFVN